MEMQQQTTLREQPEIMELLQTLQVYGLSKEHQEVEHLVSYLEGMEKQFGQISVELKEVHKQLEVMQDKGAKASAVRIVEKVENKIGQIGRQFHTVKDKLICSAKNAVAEYKEKGISVLAKAVKAMKISSALSYLKNSLGSCSKGLEKDAENIATIRGELHLAKGHMKNIGRTLTGTKAEQPQVQTPDSGILFKVQNLLLSCSKQFSKMEKVTENAIKKVENLEERKEGKASVKNELKKIKGRKAGELSSQSNKSEQIR